MKPGKYTCVHLLAWPGEATAAAPGGETIIHGEWAWKKPSLPPQSRVAKGQ